MFIRHVTVKAPEGGAAFQLWPVDEQVRSGVWTVTVKNLATSIVVSVVDDRSKTTVGQGVEIAAGAERTFGPMGADALWAVPASGEPPVLVIACSAPALL